MVTDTIADFLSRMSNAISRKKENTQVPKTKMVSEIVNILKAEGMINGFEEEGDMIKVVFTYKEGEPMITRFIRVSKPGQRIYVTSKEILPVMNGRGISVVSTSKGVMTGARAKNMKLGGELICEIW